MSSDGIYVDELKSTRSYERDLPRGPFLLHQTTLKSTRSYERDPAMSLSSSLKVRRLNPPALTSGIRLLLLLTDILLA